MDSVGYKNGAVRQLSRLKGGQSTVSRRKLSINQVARQSAEHSGDAETIKQGLPQIADQQNTLLKSAGIALGLIALFVLAVKYKIIKL